MFELRPYQKRAVDAGLDFLRTNKNPKLKAVIIAPTGSGKSLLIGHMAQEMDTGTIVLQPSKELLEQNYEKFMIYGGKASIYSASMGIKEVGKVTFATIGSVYKKPELFEHIRNVIIDECHLVKPAKVTKNNIDHSMFTQFISALTNVNVLGLTATAFRLKKFADPFTGLPYSQINLLNRMRPLFFNHFIDVTQIRQLYDEGYLCPVKYLPLMWDNGKLVPNTTGAEFSEESIDNAIIEQKIIERIPRIVADSIKKGRKHRIVFVKKVEDAKRLASIVPDSEYVSALTKKKERKSIITLFKAGEVKTVFNVGVLTIGFDFPALDTIIIARPTKSLALYMQMIGRGIRLFEGKEDCAVVDMCGNYSRFGIIEDIHYRINITNKWELANKNKLLSNVKMF